MATYGVYTFPSPEPIFSESNSPVYFSGLLDHNAITVNLLGALTGDSIAEIYRQKQELISGLSSGYANLSLGNTGYDYANPVSINFGDSNQTRYLPYDITFQAYEDKSFSNFFGIAEPVNTWNFQEQDGRIVNVTRTVGAKGIKIDSSSPLNNARTFVNAILNDYENDISYFWSRNKTGILTNKTEEVDRLTNKYSVTENYLVSTSNQPITASGILTATTQISYDKEDGLNTRVNGTLQGGLTGEGYHAVNTGMFGPSDAKSLAIDAIEKTRSAFESDVYQNIYREPSSYNYTLNEAANKMDFSFEFRDATTTASGETVNKYTVDVAGNKDNGLITANVNGSIEYKGVFDIFDYGDAPETGVRWAKVNSGFSGFNPYSVALNRYQDFVNINIYEDSGWYSLFPFPSSESVNKDPFNSKIDYQFSYDNRIDITSGQLNNASFSINYTQPINKTGIVETINGYSTQKTHERTAGEKSINGRADNVSGIDNANVVLLKDYASGLIRPFSILTREDYSAGQSSITVDISALY